MAHVRDDLSKIMGSLSTLELLPREIIWKIVGYAPESVFELILSSRFLQTRVIEFAHQRLTDQLVESLELRALPKRISIKILVPKCNSDLFELRLKYRQLPATVKFTRICVVGHPTGYILELTLPIVDEEMLAHLRECIGSRVNKTTLINCNDAIELSAITTILNGIQFRSMEIIGKTLFSETFDVLPSIIKNHDVDTITLSIREVALSDAANVLLELANYVHSIHIYQQVVFHRNTHRRHINYLFGIHDGDWATIILELFSRKMDKLWIENTHFQQYLPKVSADRLREQLPLIGKKVWFKATCNKYEDGIHETINGHLIQADRAGIYHNSLRIMHESRAEESFQSF